MARIFQHPFTTGETPMNNAETQPRLALGDRPTGHAPLTNMSLMLQTLMGF